MSSLMCAVKTARFIYTSLRLQTAKTKSAALPGVVMNTLGFWVILLTNIESLQQIQGGRYLVGNLYFLIVVGMTWVFLGAKSVALTSDDIRF